MKEASSYQDVANQESLLVGSMRLVGFDEVSFTAEHQQAYKMALQVLLQLPLLDMIELRVRVVPADSLVEAPTKAPTKAPTSIRRRLQADWARQLSIPSITLDYSVRGLSHAEATAAEVNHADIESDPAIFSSLFVEMIIASGVGVPAAYAIESVSTAKLRGYAITADNGSTAAPAPDDSNLSPAQLSSWVVLVGGAICAIGGLCMSGWWLHRKYDSNRCCIRDKAIAVPPPPSQLRVMSHDPRRHQKVGGGATREELKAAVGRQPVAGNELLATLHTMERRLGVLESGGSSTLERAVSWRQTGMQQGEQQGREHEEGALQGNSIDGNGNTDEQAIRALQVQLKEAALEQEHVRAAERARVETKCAREENLLIKQLREAEVQTRRLVLLEAKKKKKKVREPPHNLVREPHHNVVREPLQTRMPPLGTGGTTGQSMPGGTTGQSMPLARRAQQRQLEAQQRRLKGRKRNSLARARSSSGQQGEGWANGVDKEAHFRAQLLAIYAIECPEKISEVESLVRRYRGREAYALQVVHEKYGIVQPKSTV
jgi:hypothetical protein